MCIEQPLVDALKHLARGTETDLSALLHDVERHIVIDGTNITTHCHCLTLDGNGRPRIADLVRVVAEHVLDYAIPRSEIQDAWSEIQKTGSSQKLVRLTTKARGLFTDLMQSGEGGELLLFALAEKLLRLPQLICKMSLKTNTRMHVHGADGLHAGVDEQTGKLLLYWGESKIFGDVTSAIRECLSSLAPMLLDQDSSRRDMQLLQRHLDIGNEALENALKKFLNPDDPTFNLLEFRGLGLVGFDSDAYPKEPSKIKVEAVVKTIASTLPRWKQHVAKRVNEEKIDDFSMHFLFVPFPSADEFRQLLRVQLGLATESSKHEHVVASSSSEHSQAQNSKPPTTKQGRKPKAAGKPHGTT